MSFPNKVGCYRFKPTHGPDSEILLVTVDLS